MTQPFDSSGPRPEPRPELSSDGGRRGPEPGVWVIASLVPELTAELLGDARRLADALGVAVTVVDTGSSESGARWMIAQGADSVWLAETAVPGMVSRLASVARVLPLPRPRFVFAGATGEDRLLAARLAVRCSLQLISPALLVRLRHGQCEVTALHPDGRRARQVVASPDESTLVTLRSGVGQAMLPDQNRRGTVTHYSPVPASEPVILSRTLAADPATTDIQHLPRLVAGGRGVGGPEGFELLRSVAARLDAGIAASRMAVDLGWIERERQVGQSGRTVAPELYIACGISGASHHLEGMSHSRQIVALNPDPQAPIFRVAHLGLVCDGKLTLQALLRMLRPVSRDEPQ